MTEESNTPTPEQAEELLARRLKNDAESWLTQLMSSVGRHSIAPEVRTQILACTDRAAINKIFFEYHTSQAEKIDKLSAEQIQVLNSIVTPETSPEYISTLRLFQDLQASAAARLRDVDNYLAAAAKHYIKMEQIKGNASIPLASKVQDILSLGWYKLKEVHDNEVDFVTPPISIKNYNADAGIHQDVAMGSYLVIWYPRNGAIKVYENYGNITESGHIHPHISADGSICWGNAKAVAIDSLTKFNPAPAFEALQVILQNYNAESPYVSLQRFATRREQDRYAGMPTVYRRYEDAAWILTDNMPDAWAKTYQIDADDDYYDEDNDSTTTRYLMQMFIKTYEDGTRVPNEEHIYYIKYSNGRYFAIHDNDINEWT